MIYTYLHTLSLLDALPIFDRLSHMNREAERALLIVDRARDRLPDPPCRIGAELVAAAVFELIDRLHQPDIAFLDQIQELQPAIGVFLGDRDHEAQIGLDHLLLGDPRLAFALLQDRKSTRLNSSH